MLKNIIKITALSSLMITLAHADNFGGYEAAMKIGDNISYADNVSRAHAVSGGAELGYNWLLTGNYILGVTADYDYSDATHHHTSNGGYVKYGSSITSFDVLAGSVIDDGVMMYVKFGNAYVQGVDASRPLGSNGAQAAFGMDFTMSENVSTGLEYSNTAIDKNGFHWTNNLVDATIRWHF